MDPTSLCALAGAAPSCRGRIHVPVDDSGGTGRPGRRCRHYRGGLVVESTEVRAGNRRRVGSRGGFRSLRPFRCHKPVARGSRPRKLGFARLDAAHEPAQGGDAAGGRTARAVPRQRAAAACAGRRGDAAEPQSHAWRAGDAGVGGADGGCGRPRTRAIVPLAVYDAVAAYARGLSPPLWFWAFTLDAQTYVPNVPGVGLAPS